MEVVTRIPRMREISRKIRSQGNRIGFVPTMGAFHEGHVSLIRRAKEVSDVVVVSIFVNPMQFEPGIDYDTYPRDLAGDAEWSAKEGVDYVFAPSAGEMYPKDFSTKVEVEGLSDGMCGAFRPGHFTGVVTVVLKLLHIVHPQVAVFGEKDYQQLVVIRRMAAELNLDVEILEAPILREKDGLALSSRNRYLSDDERRAAQVLSRALREAERLFEEGQRAASAIEEAVRTELASEPHAKTEYIALVDPVSLRPVSKLEDKTLVALAVRIGTTRLIDNTVLADTLQADAKAAQGTS